MKIRIQIVLILLVTIIKSQEVNQYIPGMLMLNTTTPLIFFPAEIYGINVSYPNNGDNVKIEKIMYLEFAPNSRKVVKEQIIDYHTFKIEYAELRNSIQLNIPNELIKIFSRYHVYSIRRLSKVFFPSDTLPHYINRRDGKKILTTSMNKNKSLLIKFDENYEVIQVANAIKTHDLIISVEFNQPVHTDPDFDSPVLIEYSEPILPDSLKSKNIEGMAILKITVNENGKVTGSDIIKSNLDINLILLKTVKKWRFKPGTRDGIPCELNMTIALVYEKGKLIKPSL